MVGTRRTPTIPLPPIRTAHPARVRLMAVLILRELTPTATTPPVAAVAATLVRADRLEARTPTPMTPPAVQAIVQLLAPPVAAGTPSPVRTSRPAHHPTVTGRNRAVALEVPLGDQVPPVALVAAAQAVPVAARLQRRPCDETASEKPRLGTRPDAAAQRHAAPPNDRAGDSCGRRRVGRVRAVGRVAIPGCPAGVSASRSHATTPPRSSGSHSVVSASSHPRRFGAPSIS